MQTASGEDAGFLRQKWKRRLRIARIAWIAPDALLRANLDAAVGTVFGLCTISDITPDFSGWRIPRQGWEVSLCLRNVGLVVSMGHGGVSRMAPYLLDESNPPPRRALGVMFSLLCVGFRALIVGCGVGFGSVVWRSRFFLLNLGTA